MRIYDILSEDVIEKMNNELFSNCAFKFKFISHDGSSNAAEIELKDTRGIEYYTIGISRETRIEIENWFKKNYDKEVYWNNTGAIFWLNLTYEQ